ncbi:MAG: polysaccharide deacetylase family protein, partial [Candidatus Latescibacteria bacterium]|nr:polysaccharide deacetylase family protein [Candidatus Latescibacterota bacterium]
MKSLSHSLIPVSCLLTALLFFACSEEKVSAPVNKTPAVSWDSFSVRAKAPKWNNGRTAAVTITYDSRWNGDSLVRHTIYEALDRGLPISLEMVTSYFVDEPELLLEIQELHREGVSFYGHGHTHANFDDMSYDFCFDQFQRCFQYMQAWGLNPKSYAYPYGKGFKSTTKLANRMAGFICARGLTFLSNPNYICEYDDPAPLDWHYLPCISIAKEYEGYVNNHDMLSKVLDINLEKTSWVILMYHSIGFPDAWGYYPMDDYLADLDDIVSGDFWCASMDDVACYISERNGFYISAKEMESSDDRAVYQVRFIDRLDNDVYDYPLTVDLSFDGADVEKIS